MGSPHITEALNRLPFEIHCGRHSGFPECCIKFFVSKWIWAWHDNSKFYKAYWVKMEKLKKHPGYIPCPKCLKNKTFIKVKSCPKSCRFKKSLYGNDWFRLKWFKDEK